MFDLRNISSWRKDFGLFPISIKPTNKDQYALLNGGQKDFCIDLDPINDVDSFNSYAWSANTKNYLAVSADNVVIYNWLKSSIERIKISDVENNIIAFYNYLGKHTYNTGNDVVPFIINLQSSSGGTLYCEKITVHPFQKAKIYISPEKRSTKYALETITVNGEDCTAAVRLESLTLEHIWGDQVVEATFCVSEAPAAPASAVFV